MSRILFFKIIFLMIAIVIIARLFYWQFISAIKGGFGEVNQENILPAARGEIYSSDGFPLVANQEALLVYGKSQEVREPKKIAEILAPYLISEKYASREAELTNEEKAQREEEIKNKERSVEEKLNNKNLFWVLLSRKVKPEIRTKIDNLKIAGIGFEDDQKRYYPEASMAARVLGFVGSDKFGSDTGYFGLEGYYDRNLRGQPGRIHSDTDPWGLPILVSRYRPQEPQKGTSLRLTLDRTAQFIVEQKLKQAMEKYGAREGTIIVADPKKGHILAMATYPSYLPAIFGEYGEDFFKNPAVSDTYEPGSTFKLVTMSAALDLGLVTPETRCDKCGGSRQIGGYEISTWNKKYYPDSTMTEIIQHSDNVGMTFVAERLQLDKFYDYIIKFGLGKLSEIDLQGESSGVIRPRKEWRPIDLATASFGQGIAVTPIQMVQVVSVIANGGKLIQPRIVAKVINGDQIQEVNSPTPRQVITSKTAAQITEMMVNAVKKGEARAFAPEGYRIAGKTGTAQIPVAGHYDPDKTIASFVGFAPADDPKFVMLVRFTEPTSSPFGSETAAPTFFGITKELLNYWGIPPSK